MSFSLHATPTPNPDKVAIWALQVARHTDMLTDRGIWLAGLALAVAIAAAVFAYLAWRAAEKDLKISRDNWDRAQRMPVLAAGFTFTEPMPGYSASVLGRKLNFLSPRLIAQVWNTTDGKRRCDAFYIEVRVPKQFLSKPAQSRLLTKPMPTATGMAAVNSTMLFPGGGAATEEFNLNFDWPIHADTFTIQYRMIDDYNNYPSERNKWLEAKVQLPTRQLHEWIDPRDDAESRMLGMIQEAFNDEALRYKAYTAAFELLDELPATALPDRLAQATEITKRVIKQHEPTK